jgi:cysteine-rich repeat protein
MNRAWIVVGLVLVAGCPGPPGEEPCGDGILDVDDELCDDGNNDDGDGCDAGCQLEACGDGSVNNAGAEECDDGNNEDGDGCSAECTLQTLVTADDIQGQNPGDAFFAFFDDTFETFDSDGNGIPDSTFSSLLIVVAADPLFCQNEFGGLARVTLEVTRVEPGVGGEHFQSSETVSGAGLDANPRVFTIFEFGPSFEISAIGLGQGSVTLEEFTPGASLTATFSDTFALDFGGDAEGERDTDFDGDGLIDSKAINVAISASIVGAQHCEGL